ncbi:MAG: hypothetical protein AB8G14_19605 [Ilumatobacter sp.]
MKPPICEVCNDRFDSTPDHLVSFSTTKRGAEFSDRQRNERIVGHQPDDGWFCDIHLEQAISLSSEMTLAQAVAEMKGVRYFPPAPVEAEPVVKLDDLGSGFRIADVDGSGGIEWPIDWLTAVDIRERFATLGPAVARAFDGSQNVEFVEARQRTPGVVSGSGPDDDPWVDTVTLSGESSTIGGLTRIEVRHRQLHLNADTIIEVQVDLDVAVTLANGRRRRAHLVAWGYVSDDLCNLLRLTRVDTGPVVKLIRSAFELGTDRWKQRYHGDGRPLCLSCGSAFVKDTGGRTFFKVDAAGHDWNARMRRGEVDGDRPYAGWFCTRHIGPASLVSDSLTLPQAMPLLVPAHRSPLEYREHPDGVEVSADEHGEPSRAPFVPVSLDFEPAVVREVAIAPRIAREARTLLARWLERIGAVFGADHFRGFGTNSMFSSYQSNDMSAFFLGDSTSRLILQRREQTIFEASVTAAQSKRRAADGELLLERLVIRAATDEIAVLAEPAVDELLDELIEPRPDPFDLVPDLVEVDLCGGELRRGWGGRTSYLRWEAPPIDIGDAVERVSGLVEPLLALFGLDVDVVLEGETVRTYNPMDGAGPPDCPFTDRLRRTDVVDTIAGELAVEIDVERVHWSIDVLANVRVALSITLGDQAVRISASGDGPTCTSLTMSRPVVAGSLAVVAAAFGLVAD